MHARYLSSEWKLVEKSLIRITDSRGVELQGKDITHVAPHRRNIGMVFQGTFLFPHLTVSENIAYGLKMRKDSKESQTLRVEEMLDLIHLSNFSERDVAHLSGGETTRVAIARALAPAPSLLLLDEPLTGLDEHLRIDLAKDLRIALTTSGITAILVTHDRNEAAIVADRVVQFSDLISKVKGISTLLQKLNEIVLYYSNAQRALIILKKLMSFSYFLDKK